MTWRFEPMRILSLSFILIFLAGGFSVEADYAKGLDAVARGDYAAALREWKPLADRGDAPCQNAMGWMYFTGKGVPQNKHTAFTLYTLSADQGFAKAQHNLAIMYRKGEIIPQDYEKAFELTRLAAAQHYDAAQLALAEMYRKGQGIPRDIETALKWYKAAARERGEIELKDPRLKYYKGDRIINSRAQYRLGQLYYHGEGVKQSYKQAFKWYKRAADNGHREARSELAKMYFSGTGTERDLKKAYEMWAN